MSDINQDILRILKRIYHELDEMNKNFVSLNHRLDSIQKQLQENEKQFLNVKEASEFLGIPKQSLYSYIDNEMIPAFKLKGNRYFFRKQDLQEFILNNNR